MDPIRFGVIGAGGIADRRSIPAMQSAPHCAVAAVMDPTRAEQVAARHGIERAYRQLPALLADPGIDAVYIATPVYLHHEQVLAAAAAGKHVLCEKPLAMDVPQTRQAVENCRAAAVRLREALMMRYHGAHQRMGEIVQAGRIGRLHYMRAQLSCWFPPMPDAWRQDPDLGGGGALMDLGGHLLDLLEHFGGPLTAIHARTARQLHDYPVEDAAVASLVFQSGALGTIDTFFNVPDEACPCRLELYGSAGAILAEGTIGQEAEGEVKIRLSHPDGYDAMQQRHRRDGWEPLDFEPVNPYQAQFEAFARSILDRDDAAQDEDDRRMVRLAASLEAAYADQPTVLAEGSAAGRSEV